MAKLIKFKDNILIYLITLFVFFWDTSSLFFLNLKYLILFGYFFLLFGLEQKLKKINFNIILIFIAIIIHYAFNSGFELNFYKIKTLIFLFLISLLTILYLRQFILGLEKGIIIFIFVLTSTYLTYYIFFKIYDIYFFSIIDIFFTLNITNFFNEQKIIFIENSHFGMIAPSIIIYTLNEIFTKKNNIQIIILILTLIIAYLNFSSTFFAGLLLSSIILVITNFIYFDKKHFLIFASIIIISLISLIANYESLHKFKTIKNKVINVVDKTKVEKTRGDQSIEVLLSSYKILYHSIKNKPFGYGFNNYDISFNQNINKINYDKFFKKIPYLNIKDASNNFVKIFTESGIFFFIFLYFVILFIFSDKVSLKLKFLILPNFLTQTFIRGAGYFNGGYIIYLLLIIILCLSPTKVKND